MLISELAETVLGAARSGADTEVRSLCYDSRAAAEGSLFFALRGAGADGHDFIPAALAAGCAGVVSQRHPEQPDASPWVRVPDSRAALSAMAAAFYGHPSRGLKVAGVTGTNGKSTTALLLHSLLAAAHRRPGLLGTMFYDLGDGGLSESTHTTPESLDLQRYLAEMRDNGCRSVAMEVSSHGLDQGRAADVEFDVAIFTNLSHDHLDYHGDMASYFAAKRRLFEQLATGAKPKRLAVVNIDDIWGKKLVNEFPEGTAEVVTYGMGSGADYRAGNIKSSREGTEFALEARGRQMRVRTPLIGRFNVSNCLAALAAGVGLGLNLREAVANLASVPQVPGRLESVAGARAFGVFVDYAHTPDALENALETLRELSPRRLVAVFGCGGNRDIPKRRAMGEIAARLADYSVITSDNPRQEDPEKIIRDIESGFGSGGGFEAVVDRREAIGRGVELLGKGDILLIAGKGHEAYQQFADRTVPFDDRVVARQMLGDRDHVRDEDVRERRREKEERELEKQRRHEVDIRRAYREFKGRGAPAGGGVREDEVQRAYREFKGRGAPGGGAAREDEVQRAYREFKAEGAPDNEG